MNSTINKDIVNPKKAEQFNRRKVTEQLTELSRLITGKGLDLKQYTCKATKEGVFRFNEKKTRELIDELVKYIKYYNYFCICGYAKNIEYDDKEFSAPFLSDEEETFFRSLLYCSIRIALHEEAQDKKPATLSSILEDVKSLEIVYGRNKYTAYEDLFGEGPSFLKEGPEMTILDHIYTADTYPYVSRDTMHLYSDNFADMFLSIFDKINVYYWYLTKGRIPANADIEAYKEKDPKQYELLKQRQEELAKEQEFAVSEQRKQDENEWFKEENELYESVEWHEVYTDMPDTDYDDPDYIPIEPEEMPEPEPDFRRYKNFGKSDIFIKECELFRFYINTSYLISTNVNDWKYYTTPGYLSYFEKAEFAIDTFISENSLCGLFSDTKTSAYIFTLLSEATDLVKEKINEKAKENAKEKTRKNGGDGNAR